MLEIRDLHKHLGGKHVLRGVNLTVPTGEALVIIGGSGCGKSVLLKHILGLFKPDSGQVLVDGEDTVPLPERELFRVRKRFGMLFQGGALFDSMTVADNVSFALDEHSKLPASEKLAIVQKKLAVVGLKGVEKVYPADLSGGMKKRVALARAIAADPDFLLYDEPTTGLDPIMSDVINELIVKLKTTLNVTTIVVTHDMASARKIADKMAMLHEGTIRIHATPDELYASDDDVVKRFINGLASVEQMKEVWGEEAEKRMAK
ncbi:MAG: ABC transporter ATP-binding protein [Planctomycetia bacterium]|nr:ABC transporter ATP-binding protein [Planctomycetia bacterium]